MRSRLRCASFALSWLALACGAEPEGASYVEVLALAAAPNPKVDLLIVADQSQSMLAINAELATSIRQIVAPLEAALATSLDLHLGVVTSDLGDLGANSGGSPSCVGQGDDGVLIEPKSCPTTDALPYLRDQPGVGGARDRNYTDELGTELACRLAGGMACGIEQPLLAIERALANPANTGFFRAEAILVTVVVSDEDDCSAEPALFDPATTVLGPLSSFRCFDFGVTCAEDPRAPGAKTGCAAGGDPALVRDPHALVDAIRAAKGDDRFFLVAITGPATPVEVALEPFGGDPAPIPSLQPSCMATVSAQPISAVPGIRLREVADAAPGRAWTDSICAADFGALLADAGEGMTDLAAARGCLPGDVPGGAAACRVRTDAGVLPTCAADGAQPCATIAVDTVCDHHPSSLRAQVTGDLAGARATVECQLPQAQ